MGELVRLRPEKLPSCGERKTAHTERSLMMQKDPLWCGRSVPKSVAQQLGEVPTPQREVVTTFLDETVLNNSPITQGHDTLQPEGSDPALKFPHVEATEADHEDGRHHQTQKPQTRSVRNQSVPLEKREARPEAFHHSSYEWHRMQEQPQKGYFLCQHKLTLFCVHHKAQLHQMLRNNAGMCPGLLFQMCQQEPAVQTCCKPYTAAPQWGRQAPPCTI